MDHPSFRKGKFDINFLNDEFMNRLNELEKNKDKEEIEKVAAIFAALLKSKSSLNNYQANHSDTANSGRSRCMNDFIVSVNASK